MKKSYKVKEVKKKKVKPLTQREINDFEKEFWGSVDPEYRPKKEDDDKKI